MAIQDLYAPDEPLGSLPESMCARPKMYTTNGTLEEAGAFLDGFYSGMGSHNRSEGAQREVMAWAGFLRWASEQLGIRWGDWCAICHHLRLTFVNDDDGFEKLATLLVHYRREDITPPPLRKATHGESRYVRKFNNSQRWGRSPIRNLPPKNSSSVMKLCLRIYPCL